MTKVTIIGENKNTNKYTKIKFIKRLTTEAESIRVVEGLSADPHMWDNVELISRGYTAAIGENGMDLMFAYDTNRSEGVMYVGHFNEGIV